MRNGSERGKEIALFRLGLRNAELGWTFLETLIVLAILLVLSGGVSFVGLRYLDRAKIVATRNGIESLKLAVESYHLDTGMYPSQAQGLDSLWKLPLSPPIPGNWLGPYVDGGTFLDAWGTPYLYQEGGALGFRILSYGADGISGGEGADSDIGSSDEF